MIYKNAKFKQEDDLKIGTTPILLSDLKEDLQDDWLLGMDERIAKKYRTGKIDLIIGRYNQNGDMAKY